MNLKGKQKKHKGKKYKIKYIFRLDKSKKNDSWFAFYVQNYTIKGIIKPLNNAPQ